MTETEFISNAFLRTSLDTEFVIMVTFDKCWCLENCGGSTYFKLWLTNLRAGSEHMHHEQPIVATCQLKDLFGYHLDWDGANELISKLVEDGKLGDTVYENVKVYGRDFVYLIRCGWDLALAKERLTVILKTIYEKCNDISNQSPVSVGDFFKTI